MAHGLSMERTKNEKINKNYIDSINILLYYCSSNYCKNNGRKSF